MHWFVTSGLVLSQRYQMAPVLPCIGLGIEEVHTVVYPDLKKIQQL